MLSLQSVKVYQVRLFDQLVRTIHPSLYQNNFSCKHYGPTLLIFYAQTAGKHEPNMKGFKVELCPFAESSWRKTYKIITASSITNM